MLCALCGKGFALLLLRRGFIFHFVADLLHLVPRVLGSLLYSAASFLGNFLGALSRVFRHHFGFMAGLVGGLLRILAHGFRYLLGFMAGGLRAFFSGSARFVSGLLRAFRGVFGYNFGFVPGFFGALLHVGGRVLCQRHGYCGEQQCCENCLRTKLHSASWETVILGSA